MTKIDINAKIMFCEYCDINYTDMWSRYCECYYYIISDIEVYADGEDITKKKGKYVMVKDLIRNYITEHEQELPIEFRPLSECTYRGHVELDVENFDPKKLQLRKCVYEFEEVPFGIDAYHILYDGELITLDTEYDWEYDDGEICEDLFFEIDEE